MTRMLPKIRLNTIKGKSASAPANQGTGVSWLSRFAKRRGRSKKARADKAVQIKTRAQPK